jgi:hypothetical protein
MPHTHTHTQAQNDSSIILKYIPSIFKENYSFKNEMAITQLNLLGVWCLPLVNYFFFNSYCGTIPGVKRPGREVDHSPPSGAEVKNKLSYDSTPPIRLHDGNIKNLTLYILLNTSHRTVSNKDYSFGPANLPLSHSLPAPSGNANTVTYTLP